MCHVFIQKCLCISMFIFEVCRARAVFIDVYLCDWIRERFDDDGVSYPIAPDRQLPDTVDLLIIIVYFNCSSYST